LREKGTRFFCCRDRNERERADADRREARLVLAVGIAGACSCGLGGAIIGAEYAVLNHCNVCKQTFISPRQARDKHKLKLKLKLKEEMRFTQVVWCC
jgi:hypothetical protein